MGGLPDGDIQSVLELNSGPPNKKSIQWQGRGFEPGTTGFQMKFSSKNQDSKVKTLSCLFYFVNTTVFKLIVKSS